MAIKQVFPSNSHYRKVKRIFFSWKLIFNSHYSQQWFSLNILQWGLCATNFTYSVKQVESLAVLVLSMCFVKREVVLLKMPSKEIGKMSVTHRQWVNQLQGKAEEMRFLFKNKFESNVINFRLEPTNYASQHKMLLIYYFLLKQVHKPLSFELNN